MRGLPETLSEYSKGYARTVAERNKAAGRKPYVIEAGDFRIQINKIAFPISVPRFVFGYSDSVLVKASVLHDARFILSHNAKFKNLTAHGPSKAGYRVSARTEEFLSNVSIRNAALCREEAELYWNTCPPISRKS